MIKVLIISIILVAISGILLATSILFSKFILKKQGAFPNTSVGHNPNMQKLGITCAKGDAAKEFRRSKELLGCASDESSSGCACG